MTSPGPDRISADTARSLARLDLLLSQVQAAVADVRGEIDRITAGEPADQDNRGGEGDARPAG